MIWATTTPFEAINLSGLVLGDWWPVIVLSCGVLFLIMIVGIIIRWAGGNNVEFGLDDDELNPLE